MSVDQPDFKKEEIPLNTIKEVGAYFPSDIGNFLILKLQDGSKILCVYVSFNHENGICTFFTDKYRDILK